MEPIGNYMKNIHSPLYDRRLAIIILKKYSYGRRSFSENAKGTKIKEEHRNRRYEPETQTQIQTTKTIPTNKETTKEDPRIEYPYVLTE